MRILVVEDDAQTAALVGQALRDDGHAVDVVADGREGLKQGAVNAYDVLVVVLFALTAVFAFHHDHLWEIGGATFAFFIALFIALTNRDRLNRLRDRHKA